MTWFTVLVTIFGAFALTKPEPGCVGTNEVCSKCTCTENNSFVVCRNKSMNTVPENLPINLTHLTLNKCKITIITNDSFHKCNKLKILILSKNSISHISSSAFNDTPLETLYLQSNVLNLSSNHEVLAPLESSLRDLRIFNNSDIPDLVFRPLSNLKTLAISGYKGGIFGKGFEGLHSLETLVVHPPLPFLKSNTFEHFRNNNLKKLFLNNTGNLSIEKDTFRSLEKLEELDLSYNIALSLKNLTIPLSSLPSSIHTLKLSYISGGLSSSAMKIKNDFCDMLSNKSNLRILELDKNEITHITKEFSSSLRNVEKLILSYNRITNIFHFVVRLFLMIHLTYMDVSYQSKKFPGPNAPNEDFDDNFAFKSEEVVDKRGGPCDGFKSCWVKPKDIKCQLPRNIELGDMSVKAWCLGCPRNINFLKLDSFITTDTRFMPTVLLLGHCPLSNLSLKRNGFTVFAGPIILNKPSGKKVDIDLSFNGMTCLAPDVFNYSISHGLKIDKLILEGNRLGHQLSNDTNGCTFSTYIDLSILNLADNRITKLFENSFRGLQNLKVLNLSKNYLQVIEINISYLTSLSVLDISDNLLVVLDSNQQKAFAMTSRLRGYSNFKISLVGNPLQCSCSTIGFLAWIVSNSTKIANYYSLQCLYSDDNQQKNLSSIEGLHRNLQLYCYAVLPIAITGGLLGLAMICFLATRLAYKYRWEIRYYMLQRALNKRQQRLSTYKRSYEYDAFVCYEKSDRAWVFHELLFNLEILSFSESTRKKNTNTTANENVNEGCFAINETENLIDQERENSNKEEVSLEPTEMFNDKLRLCIHEKDFEPGREIEGNIQWALENSRKVILVVSKSFLKSQWCCLELEMAKVESLLRGVNLVVTVFLEPVEEKFVSLEWLTKYYTYLEWFKFDEYRRHEFWRRLRIAIGVRKTNFLRNSTEQC